MKPITFTCDETLPLPSDDIARQILDLTKWPEFQGFGPIPGIRAAEFEIQTPGIVGTRIRVTNTDGSSHIEEIVQWEPDRRLRLRMHEFSAPLSRLATEFMETWEFQPVGSETHLTRLFELHPRSIVAWPLLWVISFLLRRAIARHLRQMISGSSVPRNQYDSNQQGPNRDEQPDNGGKSACDRATATGHQ